MSDDKQEKTILGGRIKIKEIKQAMVKNEVNDFIDEVWAEYNLNEEELNFLKDTFDKLDEEREETQNFFGNFKKKNIDLPEHIRKLEKNDKEKIKTYCQQIQDKMEEVDDKISQHRDFLKSEDTNVGKNHWQDLGLYLIRSKKEIDKYRILRNQLFQADIIRFVENRGMSKTAAKSKAKLEKNYREYKKAKKLAENIEEYMLWCKKVYDKKAS